MSYVPLEAAAAYVNSMLLHLFHLPVHKSIILSFWDKGFKIGNDDGKLKLHGIEIENYGRFPATKQICSSSQAIKLHLKIVGRSLAADSFFRFSDAFLGYMTVTKNANVFSLFYRHCLYDE